MQKVIRYVQTHCGKDLSCYSESFLVNTLSQRIAETSTDNIRSYLEFIMHNPDETEILLKSLNNSFSQFFRNQIDFCIIEKFILPGLFSGRNSTLRIWSAACAEGQEPYSVAMIVCDLIRKQFHGSRTRIIATDISEDALAKALTGKYAPEAVQNVKLLYVNDFFETKGQVYHIDEQIKGMVEFINYDLLDTNTTSPPIGIFSEYDIIICCNLLIYYRPRVQKLILKKLYAALGTGCFLIVDESEKSIVSSFGGFRRYDSLGNIFVKSRN